MKKFKEKRYYFDMFNAEFVWLYGKDLNVMLDYVEKKCNEKVEVDHGYDFDGIYKFIANPKNDKYYHIIITRNKSLKVFTHELMHAVQEESTSRGLKSDGEWTAYFFGHLMEKLYK